MSIAFQNYYTAPSPDNWTGRVDGSDRDHLRWHHVVKCIHLAEAEDLNDCFVLLGYSCDEGVKRNLGRVGAAKAPATLRKSLSNLPLLGEQQAAIIDAGDIHCHDNNLEASQEALGEAVAHILKIGGFPIILGGGHEVTFGHYLGLRKANDKKIGIINFDAHFDIREPQDNNATSGTGFYQIAQREESFHYLPIGIQQISNTQTLFNTAQAYGVNWIQAQDFDISNRERIQEQITSFIRDIDQLYVTVDMDVFAAPYAPGVSAPAYNGIVPNSFFMWVFECIINSPKFVSIDFAELNPSYDIDNRTAKLVADLVFRVVKK
jgi:formiminoglutamase